VAPSLWKTPTLKLAIVGIEFADTKHNPKDSPEELEKLLLSRDSYKQTATGQTAVGSLHDYLNEVSSGALKLEKGKAFPWVELTKKRGDYVQGSGTSNRTAPLIDTLNKLTSGDAKDALKDFDAIVFIYAGDRFAQNRGAVFYPHAGTIMHQQKRIPYMLIPEGTSRLTQLGGLAKEAAMMLGLPDLTARREIVGSVGLGPWCALSTPDTERPARPPHLSAWAKEKLGWIEPRAIDPTVKQKLILAPIENSKKECFKVLVRPDGSEYFLLENRKKTGFDSDLPGEGLLIWRVVNDRPILEASHGVDGPTAPNVHLAAIPYPSAANNAFTPNTIPSSRSPQGGGLPVNITSIKRHPDGRISFRIGYEYD
jgi:M6 family metalloprotease-like protein